MIQNNPAGGRTIIYSDRRARGRVSNTTRTFTIIFAPSGLPPNQWVSFNWTVKDGTTYTYGYPPMADGVADVPFENTLNKTGLDPSFQPTGGKFFNASYRSTLVSKVIFL